MEDQRTRRLLDFGLVKTETFRSIAGTVYKLNLQFHLKCRKTTRSHDDLRWQISRRFRKLLLLFVLRQPL